MAPTEHILSSFDRELKALQDSITNMGMHVIDNCSKATRCYRDSDNELALEVINSDLQIDAAFEEVRADCFNVLHRFQPVASDLRLVMAIEHSAGDLERAGDHAKNIARRVISNPSRPLPGPNAARLSELSDAIVESLGLAVEAMVHRDVENANNVVASDERIDALHDLIFDSVMVQLQGASTDARWLVQELFVSKSLERIGDHATNIAEEVLFLTRGVPPGATRTT